ncbi:WD40 repeat domain-containing protein [Sulfurimonas sp. MAG313]|nr:WD40 repeat domain-containing protein [Sulfurimonas sp. MAG313]MDF1879979.1 WD40 repeat domain-containing protein [Sulfurimonas sp. MAG313]
MIKIVCVLLSMLVLIQAKDIKPSFSLHTKGIISDFVVEGERLYVSTDLGRIDIFDLKTKKRIEQIVLEPIKSTRNTMVPASISSVDVFKSKLLIVSRGLDNYRNVWIYEDYKLKKIIGTTKKLLIKEAHFKDGNMLVFASIDGDISLYDRNEKASVYTHHVTDSRLSDMVLSSDKKKIIIADESGEVKMFDSTTAKQFPDIPAKNVDNIFNISHSNGTTITGGQDRRVVVYQENEKPYYLKSNFFIYSVGLSPSGKIGAYSDGEDSDIQVFDINTKQKLKHLVGHTKIIRKIHFISENRLISSDQGHDIFFWEF